MKYNEIKNTRLENDTYIDGHKSPISGVAVFKEIYIATAGYDNQVILWDAKKGVALSRGFHDHLANQCSFSSCGTKLVSSGSDNSVRIWSVPDLKIISILDGHNDDIEMAIFSTKGQQIATCSLDGKINIYNNNGKLEKSLVGHVSYVKSIAWSNDDQEIISSGEDGTIRRWNVSTGYETSCLDFSGIQTDTLIFSADGRAFVGDDNGLITIINKEKRTSYNAHSAGIKKLLYCEKRNILISASYDKFAIFWDVSSNEPREIFRTVIPWIVWPRSLAFFGDNQVVFGTFGSTYATFDMTSKSWDTSNIKKTHGLNFVSEFSGHIYTSGDSGKIYCDGIEIAKIPSLCNFVIPFGQELIAGGQTGEIFEIKTGRILAKVDSPLNCAVTYTLGLKRFAVVGTYTGHVIVLSQPVDSTQDIQPDFKVIRWHENAIKDMVISEDSIVAVCSSGAASVCKILDLENPRLYPSAHSQVANGCASLLNKHFVTVSRDRNIVIWNEEGPKQNIKTPHLSSVKSVAASLDGHFILTGAYDGSIAIYDCITKAWLPMIRPTNAGISRVCFNSVSKKFVAASYDGTLYSIDSPLNTDTLKWEKINPFNVHSKFLPHVLIIDRVGFNKYIAADGTPYLDINNYDITLMCTSANASQVPAGAVSRIIELDILDCNLIEQRACELHEILPIQRICAFSEFHILLAAQLRERFELAGQRESKALTLRNKMAMKEKVRAAKLRAPFYAQATRKAIEDFITCYNKVVVKPISGSGSRGIYYLTSNSEISKLIENLGETISNYQVEEFIEGDLFHIDGIVQNGRVLWAEVTRYVNLPTCYLEGIPNFAHLETCSALKERLLNFNIQIVNALEIRDAVIHHECFVKSGGEIVFCEIAGRAGGNGIIPYLEKLHGINLYQAMFDVQLQRPITLKLNSIDDSVLGYIGFVIEDGVVDSIPSLEIMDHPNILTYFPQVSVGEVCERSRFSGQASAIFVVRSKDIKSLVTTYKDIKEMFENNMKYRSIEESV